MRNIKGFTLIELLLYMGLFSVLLIPLMQLFGSTIAVRLESEATSAVSQDGGYILTRLTNDIHDDSAIITPPLGSSGTSLHIIGDNNYTYELDGDNNLTLTDNGTGEKNALNSANTTVSNLNFKTLGNAGGKNTVRVNLVVKSKVIRQGGINQTKSFTTTIGTR
ncbi:prepilin-type N-terminal cleavage/methylation domain-containing protein [Candidatus Microgenomates bacterium]|nr:prepilin-type N-terminal cleavage/methylation domain-containing protein [Candidatus Microgenomates bacterium]